MTFSGVIAAGFSANLPLYIRRQSIILVLEKRVQRSGQRQQLLVEKNIILRLNSTLQLQMEPEFLHTLVENNEN
jgi:hypothetical protein